MTGGIEYKTLGNINFVESRARFSLPYLRGALWAEVKHNLLDSTEPGIILPARNEVDITAEYKHPWREGIFQANVGGNLREVDSLPHGAVRVNQALTGRVKANFRLAMNEMSHETGALRALGKKDTILFGLSAQLPQQTFFHVDVDGHRYETRGGSNLGKGYKVQMILGRSLLSGFQDWQVRLQGSWESNQLAATLPSDLSGLLSPSLSNVQTLIPKKFALMGIGTSFRYGPSDQGVVRRPFILADAWVGGVWPANDLGYNGRLSMGTSLFGPDILSVGAFYSNVQGGRTDQAFAGVGVTVFVSFLKSRFPRSSLLNNKKAPGFDRGLISAPHLAGVVTVRPARCVTGRWLRQVFFRLALGYQFRLLLEIISGIKKRLRVAALPRNNLRRLAEILCPRLRLLRERRFARL